MSDTNVDLDQSSPSSAQVSPKEHPHLEWMRKEISEEFSRLNSNKGEINMSDPIISKDWVEKSISSIDNKIEMEKVRSDAKFDKLISQSDAKFDRLFAELKFESERNSLKIDSTSLKFDASIARLETNITRWMLGIIFSILGLGFAIWRSAQPAHETYAHPDPAISQTSTAEIPRIVTQAPPNKHP